MSESETPATPSREERIEDYLKKREDINDKLSGGLPEEKFREAVKQYAEEAGKAGDEDFRLLFEAEVMFFEHRESGRDTSDMTAAIAKIEEALQWQEKNFAENDPCGAFYLTFHFWGRALHFQGDYSGAIEKYQEVLNIKPDFYLALYNWGNALYRLGDHSGAIEKFKEVLKIKPDYYQALYNWVLVLHNLGDYSGAIEKYKEVLKIKPDFYQALNNWGIALGNLGDSSGAIEKFQEALKIKPDFYQALNNWGLVLHNLGKYSEAIKKYEEALKIKPDDYQALGNWGNALYRLGDYLGAIEKYREALKIKPEVAARKYVDACLKNNVDPLKDYKKHSTPLEFEKHKERIEFEINRADNFRTKSAEFQQLIKEEKKRYDKTLTRESRMPDDRSLLMVLRKWNSYTPAIPVYNRVSVGGGYFIWHKGTGTMIDPGYNFLENFFRAGGSMADIDNIIITHSHDDHTIQFEQIISLVIKYNEEQNKKQNKKQKENEKQNKEQNVEQKDGTKKKKIRFYLSLGTFQKFSGIIDLTSELYADNYTVLNVGDTVQFPGGRIKVLPTYHFEILSHDYGIGLLFELDNLSKDDKKRILLTSDTGLVPLNQDEKTSAVPRTDYDKEKDYIHQKYQAIYGKDKIDLMLLHIGSIKAEEMSRGDSPNIKKIVTNHVRAKEELKGNHLTEAEKTEQEKIRDSYYPNHLGWLGVKEVIANCKPKIAVISEWGEELKHFRYDATLQLEWIIWDRLSRRGFVDSRSPKPPRVIPGDLSFVYDIFEEKFFNACSVLDDPDNPSPEKWVSYVNIDCMPSDDNNPVDFYYFEGDFEGQVDGFERMKKNREYFKENREDIIDLFLHYQKHRKKLWFKG